MEVVRIGHLLSDRVGYDDIFLALHLPAIKPSVEASVVHPRDETRIIVVRQLNRQGELLGRPLLYAHYLRVRWSDSPWKLFVVVGWKDMHVWRLLRVVCCSVLTTIVGDNVVFYALVVFDRCMPVVFGRVVESLSKDGLCILYAEDVPTHAEIGLYLYFLIHPYSIDPALHIIVLIIDKRSSDPIANMIVLKNQVRMMAMSPSMLAIAIYCD